MRMFRYNFRKLSLYHVVNSKQLMYTAPTVHCTLPFGIALCSVDLFGLVFLVDHGPVLEIDAGWRSQSVNTRRYRLQDIILYLHSRTKAFEADLKGTIWKQQMT